MSELFKTIEVQEQSGRKAMCIGIRVRIGERQTTCPVSDMCNSYREVLGEVEVIKENLERVLEETKAYFGGAASSALVNITPDMSPEEIWSALSGVEEEALFMESFNALLEETRRAVAEHVLTRCNIFSGNASIFSSRYDSDTGLME